MKRIFTAAVVTLGATLSALASPALTVIGPDATGNRLEIKFEIEDLRAMDATAFETTNPYVDETTTYRGPLLRNSIATLNIDDDTLLRLRAENDYSVSVPISDVLDYSVIVAYEANGEEMSLREKGPLWVMNPISENAELNDPIFHSRLIWQLVAIEVE